MPPHEWNVDFPHLMLRAKAASIPLLDSTVNALNKNQTFRGTDIGREFATYDHNRQTLYCITVSNKIQWLPMDKDAYFVADTQEVLRSFPAEVRRLFGYEIMRLQQGLRPIHYRPMTKAIGPGVTELKVKYRSEYRAFYTVNPGDAVYIINAFRKKAQKTPKAEIDLAKARLAELKKALRRK